MYYTETEAADRVCPMTLGREQRHGCLGSKCMLWRDAPSEYKTTTSPDAPEGEGWKLLDHWGDTPIYEWHRERVGLGYCGMVRE